MKKILKIGGIVLGIIIVLMILIPIMFKGKIKDAVLDAANKQLNATVSIEDFGLSLFSNFPKATILLENVKVIGTGDFAADTLLQAKSADATIDLSSLFGDNIRISKITLDNASVLAKVLEDGRPNWDIVKETGEEEEVVEEESGNFSLDLQKITVKNCTIVYDDLEGKMKATLIGWNGNISGDFSASSTTIKTTSKIDEITVKMAGVPYLNKVKGEAEAHIEADLDNMKFKFIKSKLKLNDLAAGIDGTFGFVGEEGMEFDLKLLAPDTKFKNILSIVPAMYTKEFKDIKTDGTASLDAYIKGVMEGETYPAFDVKLNVENAMFQYPSLPQAVNGINIKVGVTSKGGSLDNTIVDVSKFTVNIAGNPFNMTLHLTTPMSDANIKAAAKGKIDLGNIKNVYPFEAGTELNGVITMDMDVATRMSLIEKEQYEQVQAKGTLALTDMLFKSKDAQDVMITKAGLELTPRYVNLNSFDVKIGKNDISATGRLENFIAYALKDQTLKGQLNIKSNYLNLNDFMGDDTEEVAATDTTASEPLNELALPKNLNLGLNADFKQIQFAKIDITNFAGAMTLKNGILSLNNVGANLLKGSCKMTGAFDTSVPKASKVNFALDLSNVSFAETFKSVEAIQKLAPIFENLEGNYGMKLNFDTKLGATSDATLQALNATGNLQTKDLKLENVPALNALSSALKTDALKKIEPKDINIAFTVKEGRVATKPFTLNLGQGGTMKMEGSTGLDQTIDYLGTVTLPKGLSNDYVNNVPVTIKGTFASPKIGVDAKAMAGEALSGLANKLLGGKDKDEAKAEVGEKIAEKSAENAQKLRDEAKSASDKLVAEAEKQAAAMEEKAEGKLAKLGAKKAGQALVDQAKKSGQKLIDSAEENAKKLEGGK